MITILSMSPVTAFVLGALLGALMAAVIVVSIVRRPPAPLTEIDSDALAADLASLTGLFEDAIAVVGPHDEVLGASRYAEVMGIVKGRRIAVNVVLDAMREARRTGESNSVTVEVSRGLGESSLPLMVHTGQLRDGYMLVVADDRAEAQRVENTRRDFMTNVTHELKTPVGAIQLLAEALEEDETNADKKRFAQNIIAETGRLSTLISQIISWSKMQSTDPLHNGTVVDVANLIDSIVQEFQHQATKNKVRLLTATEPDLFVLGDEEQLRTVTINLVTNALNHTPSGGRITVSGSQSSENVTIQVSDTGVGISETDQERIFERFYRVDFDRNRDKGGSGLGLSIVRLVTDAHGGTVSVWSSLGQGSTFTVNLPNARIT